MKIKSLFLAAALATSSLGCDFSFKKCGFVEDRPYAMVPSRLMAEFIPMNRIDNAHYYLINLNLISYETPDEPLINIGQIDGQVIAGDCPSRYSDGIYEAFGRHIRIGHFNIKNEYQGKGYGQSALKLFFSLFDKIGFLYKLEVNEDNKRAIHIFEKFGFKKVDDVYGCNFDDVYSMIKPKK